MAVDEGFTPLVCRADCIGHSHSGVWLASKMLAHVLIPYLVSKKLAVDVGFEPSRRLAAPYRFSKPASSAT